ncbi:hypothetical protein Tco_0489225 [Tanacetum coccineum]
MVEPEKPLKKKDQIELNEELALKLHAKEQAELEKERVAQEEASRAANIKEMDSIQAMIEADEQLAARLQAEEQEQFCMVRMDLIGNCCDEAVVVVDIVVQIVVRIERLEEEVHDLRRDVVGMRGDVTSFTTEQSRVSTWLISCVTQLMDASGQTYQPFDSTLVGGQDCPSGGVSGPGRAMLAPSQPLIPMLSPTPDLSMFLSFVDLYCILLLTL